jgi:hypothetical protein
VRPLGLLASVSTTHGRTLIVAKHLLDETAEFTLPTAGRHAADGDDDATDRTQRFDAGVRRQPPVPGRADADGRAR